MEALMNQLEEVIGPRERSMSKFGEPDPVQRQFSLTYDKAADYGVQVDHTNITYSVKSVNIQAEAGETPVVTLELSGSLELLEGSMEVADIKLSQDTIRFLKRMGWSPPEVSSAEDVSDVSGTEI